MHINPILRSIRLRPSLSPCPSSFFGRLSCLLRQGRRQPFCRFYLLAQSPQGSSVLSCLSLLPFSPCYLLCLLATIFFLLGTTNHHHPLLFSFLLSLALCFIWEALLALWSFLVLEALCPQCLFQVKIILNPSQNLSFC